MRVPIVFSLAVATVFAQESPGGRNGMSFVRMSPILNAVDVNQDGTLSADEMSGAPAQLRKLDKNGDGKLTREEAGLQMPGGRGGRGGEEGPAQAPSAAELTQMLMAFDSNKDGQLEKSEVPERMQGLFERGDANRDGVLTRDEIAKLAEANRQQPQGEGGRGGGGRGPRGPGQFDLAFNALDTDRDGEISAEEINHAAASLKALDKNGDGSVTEEEVTPAFGGRGFGRGPGAPNREQ